MKDCKHDWDIENTHPSKRKVSPLNAFQDEFYVDSMIISRRCKKCGYHEVIEN